MRAARVAAPAVLAAGVCLLLCCGPSFADEDGAVRATDPRWTSLLPPLCAILLALFLRQVYVALFAGVVAGALLVEGGHPLAALLRSLDRYVLGSLAEDSSHLTIVLFSLLLGGMVGVISRGGGMDGLVDVVARRATSPRRVQVAAWIMGILVFFDDYANTLIVGTTMRPLADRLRVSREKLSYIVDSTAAPVACIALVSTWIGFELGLIHDAFESLGIDRDPYTTFVASIPYNFYPLCALAFGLSVAVMQRDFGPMLSAERRARGGRGVVREGARPLADFDSAGVRPPEDAPRRWVNALLPIVAVVVVTTIGLWGTGRAAAGPGAPLREVLSEADSLRTLLWAASAGGALALALVIGQRVLSLGDAVEAWTAGIRALVPAGIIMVLAWSIGSVCRDLHTAEYVNGLLRGEVNPALLPALIFTAASLMSFATGTSWGTMAVLMPLAVPASHQLGAGSEAILLGGVSAVLAGSVLGDHCSPISDTTILSSMASSCDHVDHVRTQLPYAIAVGVVAILFGYLPSAAGLSPLLCLAAAFVALGMAVRFLGRKHDDPPPEPGPS